MFVWEYTDINDPSSEQYPEVLPENRVQSNSRLQGATLKPQLLLKRCSPRDVHGVLPYTPLVPVPLCCVCNYQTG